MEIWVDPANPVAKRTINEALAEASPGDVVLVAPGIYRETVTFVRSGSEGAPITLRSVVPQGAVIRGSEVVRAEALTPGVHEIEVPAAERNPFALGLAGSRIGATLGQVFVGEHMLREVTDLDVVARTPGTWAALDEGRAVRLHVSAGWAPGEVEFSFRDRLLAPKERGMGHFVIEGFLFERCANDSAAAFWESHRRQCGAVGFRAGHHILFRRNTFRFAKTIGMDIGVEGGLDLTDESVPYDNRVEDCLICDNGEVGICGRLSKRTVIRGNRIERNASLSPHTV